MKVADLDLLLIPGWTAPSPDLWMSRWARQIKTAHIVEQSDWETPQLADWVGEIQRACLAAERPIALIAHSCGVSALVHAMPSLPRTAIKCAFLVAPPDLDAHQIWPATDGGFRPVPLDPLGLPAMVIASSDDPYCSQERAKAFAAAWGADFKDVGAAGHINTASGHGPWPEGSLALAHFLKRI
ncbi:MAG: alpha/beta hydrolase [Pseudomonadota bacterium]